MTETKTTISILKSDSPPVPDIGDILSGGKFLSELISDKEAEELRVMSLSNNHENHWKALDRMGIDASVLQKEVEYECPFRDGVKFYRIYPIAISKLKASEGGVYLTHILEKDPDTEFFHQPPMIDDVDRSFMGHGYDHCILPHDGHGDWKLAKMNLSDRRWLIVTYFEWCNK